MQCQRPELYRRCPFFLLANNLLLIITAAPLYARSASFPIRAVTPPYPAPVPPPPLAPPPRGPAPASSPPVATRTSVNARARHLFSGLLLAAPARLRCLRITALLSNSTLAFSTRALATACPLPRSGRPRTPSTRALATSHGRTATRPPTAPLHCVCATPPAHGHLMGRRLLQVPRALKVRAPQLTPFYYL